MQPIVVPSSLRSLVEEKTLAATRQFQIFLGAVKDHIDAAEKEIVSLTESLLALSGRVSDLEKSEFPLGAMALLPNGATVPANWKNVGTVTIGVTPYQLISRTS